MVQKSDFQTLINEKDLPIVKLISKAAKPYSQRALALLELNKGCSLEEAAEISGLRVTQVKYWQRVYKTSGLDAFPADLLEDETELEDIAKALKAEDKKDSISRPPSAKSIAKKTKKAKKSKKTKKDKKSKKTKKSDKKKKKGKKSKKK